MGKVQHLGATWNLAHLPPTVKERMVLTRTPILVALLETSYVYEVQDVHGNSIWNPMLNNGVITNVGCLIQPLFNQEGFQKLTLNLVDSRGSPT